jgi:hypothetical protein
MLKSNKLSAQFSHTLLHLLGLKNITNEKYTLCCFNGFDYIFLPKTKNWFRR